MAETFSSLFDSFCIITLQWNSLSFHWIFSHYVSFSLWLGKCHSKLAWFIIASSKFLPLFSEQSHLASHFEYFFYYSKIHFKCIYSVLSPLGCFYFLFMSTYIISLRSSWSLLPFDKWWYCGINRLRGKAHQLRVQEFACSSSFLPDCTEIYWEKRKSHSFLHVSVPGVTFHMKVSWFFFRICTYFCLSFFLFFLYSTYVTDLKLPHFRW